MSTLLILYIVVLGPGGQPMESAIGIPWPGSVDSCNLYLVDPTPFRRTEGVQKILGGECVPIVRLPMVRPT